MKAKANAKQKREADESRRKERWAPKREAPVPAAPVPAPSAPPAAPRVKRMEDYPAQSPEEDTREFLEYLEKFDGPVRKDEPPAPGKRKGKSGTGIRTLYLKEDMPAAEEAIRRMRMGLQEARAGGAAAVKLVHGYGSTGKGGKIRTEVRKELAEMKRKKVIRDFIPGEDFGPLEAASRRLAEADRNVTRDPDYGRMNHGITVVIL